MRDAIVFVDGRFAPGWCDLNAHEPGLTIGELVEVVGEEPRLPARPGPRQRRCGACAQHRVDGRRRGAARQEARLPSRSISRMCLQAIPPPRCIRALVVIVEPGAQVTLIESFTGPEGLDYQVNSALELVIGDKAAGRSHQDRCDGGAALHVSTLGVSVGAQSELQRFRLHTRRRAWCATRPSCASPARARKPCSAASACSRASSMSTPRW